jgi:hypothetical protein
MDRERWRADEKAWTEGPMNREQTMCSSHRAQEEQEYIGDRDGVNQVKEEHVGGAWTHIYTGNEDGVGQVKKEGECVKLGGGWIHVDTSESLLVRRA